MNEPYPLLTVDQAVSEFMATMQEHFGSTATERRGPSTETPEEAEARRFDFAESVLRLACPDPRLCTHHRCRRDRLCRHFANLHAVRSGRRKLPPSRRPPGAIVLRHAIWVFMNTRAGYEV